jgi:hypothetical protein
MKSSSAAYSLSTRSGSAAATPPATQDDLKDMMKEELRRATWESAQIVQDLLPHNINAVEEAFNGLPSTVWPDGKGWPKAGQEREYYPPFSVLLNETLKAARSALGGCPDSLYKSLCFSVYDRVTEDGIDGAHALKPDLVGCDQKILVGKKVSWHDIRIPVEVKKSWPDMVAQAATYARCMFSASAGRQYALVIAFDHARAEVRCLFFHRGGLTASPALKLKEAEGRKGFVAAVVGLASLKDRWSGGMDESFDNSHISLPDGGLWTVDSWLFIGSLIRGRGTQVVRVSRVSQEEEPKTARSRPGPPNEGADGQPGRVTRSMTRARLHAPVVALPEPRSVVKLEQAGGSERKPASGSNVKPASNAKAASGSRVTAESGNRLKGGSRPTTGSSTDPEAKIKVIERNPEVNTLACHNEISGPPSNSMPSKLVVWPLADRNNEASMYAAAPGLFGVPDVLASYEVKGNGYVHRTERFFPTDSKYWIIWNSG